MKKKILVLSLLVCLIFMGSSLFAASGKAVVSHFFGQYTNASINKISLIYVSNITSATISVKITYFENDG
ncbi:MAG: hypothetical protein GY757_57645, partial [bacterium]|nr:hypothetical protein [bacterium]